MSRGVEAIGYLGGALLLAALFVAASEFWPQLETWARVGLLAAAAVALHAAGWAVRGHPEPAIERIAAFLWLLGTACVAGAVGVWVSDSSEVTPETVALAAAVAAAIDAGALMRARPGTMQHLALFVALLAALVAALLHLGRIEAEAVAFAVWGLGIVWSLATWRGPVRPQRSGYLIGAATALVAAMAVTGGNWRGWGLALGLVTSIGLIAASVPAGSVVLLGAGTAGAFVFVTWTAVDRFADSIGVPLTLFVAGALLVGLAVVVAQVRVRYLEREASGEH